MDMTWSSAQLHVRERPVRSSTNCAVVAVLGAVPPLLDLLTSPAHHPRARRDAGMAIYHLSLAAVNQSKVARFPGASKALLSVASSAAEPTPIRRLALMVICNVGACSEGRASLMDAGAVAPCPASSPPSTTMLPASAASGSTAWASMRACGRN